jgi:hypothetical protein
MKMRRDFYGGKGLIGYTVESGSVVNGVREDVYDGNGSYMGYVDDSGTYDDMGRLISYSRSPGLLLGKI